MANGQFQMPMEKHTPEKVHFALMKKAKLGEKEILKSDDSLLIHKLTQPMRHV